MNAAIPQEPELQLQHAAAQGIELQMQPQQHAPAAAAFGIAPLLQQEQARRDFERQLSTHQFERQLSTQLSAQLTSQLSGHPQPPPPPPLAQMERQLSSQLSRQLTSQLSGHPLQPPPPPPQHSQQLERQLSSQLSAQLSAQLSTQLSGHPLQPPPPPPGLWQAHSAVPASQLRTASQPLYPNASAVPSMHRGHLGAPDFGVQPPPPPPSLQQVPDALAGIAEAAAAAAVQQFAAADAARQGLQPPLQGRRLLSATSAPGFGGAEALLAERAQRASQLLPAAGGGFTRRSFDIGVLIAMALSMLLTVNCRTSLQSCLCKDLHACCSLLSTEHCLRPRLLCRDCYSPVHLSRCKLMLAGLSGGEDWQQLQAMEMQRQQQQQQEQQLQLDSHPSLPLWAHQVPDVAACCGILPMCIGS